MVLYSFMQFRGEGPRRVVRDGVEVVEVQVRVDAPRRCPLANGPAGRRSGRAVFDFPQ
jgi:hypothetical protein